MDFLSCISIRKGGKDGFLRREADLEFDKLKNKRQTHKWDRVRGRVNGDMVFLPKPQDGNGSVCSVCGQTVTCFSFLNILLFDNFIHVCTIFDHRHPLRPSLILSCSCWTPSSS